jgi:mRNA interferase RelE/StbE
MPYSVRFAERAIADMQRLAPTARRRILRRIQWLAENFESLIPLPLTGDLAGFFKLRVGDYRVVYSIVQAERILVVQLVGHRRDIYRP